jgi:hypothetical protein
MTDNLPLDDDGDALRRLIATGSDLSKEMEIDFAVDIPNRDSGLAFARLVEPMGFRAEVHQSSKTGRWTCYCSRMLVPEYETIISIQQMLAELGRPIGAKPDGWGSFGNAPE